jgi:SRSO17 transposase
MTKEAAAPNASYLVHLAGVLGDPRRYAAMVSYCTGLLLPSERKSVEPMAAVTAPMRTAAQHQSLLYFVGQGDWSDELRRSAFLSNAMVEFLCFVADYHGTGTWPKMVGANRKRRSETGYWAHATSDRINTDVVAPAQGR